jgi:hypothetical protein
LPVVGSQPPLGPVSRAIPDAFHPGRYVRGLRSAARPDVQFSNRVRSVNLICSVFAVRRGRVPAPQLSIVVMPFANIGGDQGQDYFVDCITESLTTDLSRIPGTFVIGQNTAFTYKGKAICERIR